MIEDDFKRRWSLDPSIVFLNHGSFGATPTAILERQSELRGRLEAEPVRFMVRELEPRLDDAREGLAHFLGADAANLAFVPNATFGVNSVLQSLQFDPGDELIVTSHEYNASRNTLEHVASRQGANVVVVDIPLPLRSTTDIVDPIMAAVTPRTRLLLIDHITSQTAVIMPVAELVAAMRARGIDTLVDGAHAPGMIPLDLESLGAAWYTGNLHKWVCAPKGAAFLHVRSDRRDALRPAVISHGANSPRRDRSRFHLEFDWVGTHDPTAYLCVPAAIDFMGALLPGRWAELMERNRRLAIEGRDILLAARNLRPPVPDDMTGSMAVVPLPDNPANPSAATSLYGDVLQDELLEQYGIEVPIVSWPAPPHRLLRVSAQIYNVPDDYRRLAAALDVACWE